jgi:hypothetical protein
MNQTRASFDPFRVLDDAERESQLAAYRAFLDARDGAPDVSARRLALREPRMDAIESRSLVWEGAADSRAFAECMNGDDSRVRDARTEWVLVAGLANQTEGYGVDVELPRVTRKGTLPRLRQPDLLLSIYVQEAYHCRILAEACRCCGIRLVRRPPGIANRILIGVIGMLPGALRWIPIMAGELVGTAVFRHLAARLDLFDERPDVRETLRALLDEIWIDEVGHVAYLRAQLGPIALAAVRTLLPLVVLGVIKDLPPLRQLGMTAKALMDSLREGVEIPPGATWIEPDRSIGAEQACLHFSGAVQR